MKPRNHIFFAIFLIAGLMVASCGKSKEEQVREFALDFAEKVSKNQIDSLKNVYPGIEKADSVALKYIAEGIVIRPSEDGQLYEVVLNPDVTIFVKPIKDGSFAVTESRGLFAYPAENIDLAKKYELWNTDLPDIELAANIIQAIEKNNEEVEKQQRDKFKSQLPNLSKIYYGQDDYDNVARYLKSLGYGGSSRENGYENFDGGYSGNFKLTAGSRECLVKYCVEDHFNKVEVTINGDDALLEEYYSKAKQYEGAGIESGCTVKKKGNTIIMDSFGA